MQNSRRAVLAATPLAAILAGCAASDQVIVRNETDPYNLAAAQIAADQQCAARGGGRAQFVLMLNNPRSPGGGQGGSGSSGTPDIIYRCIAR